MRVSELWQRLEKALGLMAAESWATDYVITDLGARTVRQALADGVDAKTIWRAAHAALRLPTAER